MIVSAIGVVLSWNHLVPAVKWSRNTFYWSTTSVALAGVTKNTLYVMASNTGPKPSRLLEYRLKFSEGMDVATLELVETDQRAGRNIVLSDSAVKIALTTPGLTRSERQPGGQRWSRAEILERMPHLEATLEIDVQESRDGTGKFHTRSVAFNAWQIRDFIERKLPNE